MLLFQFYFITILNYLPWVFHSVWTAFSLVVIKLWTIPRRESTVSYIIMNFWILNEFIATFQQIIGILFQMMNDRLSNFCKRICRGRIVDVPENETKDNAQSCLCRSFCQMPSQQMIDLAFVSIGISLFDSLPLNTHRMPRKTCRMQWPEME